MNGIAGIGRHEDIARRGHGLGQVGQPFLGAQRDNGFGLGIDVHIEAALVIARHRLAQTRDPPRVGIAVGALVSHRFHQLLHDMGRRGGIGIAHAEINDVLTGRAGTRLHGVDLGEDVRRQSLDAGKFVLGHLRSNPYARWARPMDARAHGLAVLCWRALYMLARPEAASLDR